LRHTPFHYVRSNPISCTQNEFCCRPVNTVLQQNAHSFLFHCFEACRPCSPRRVLQGQPPLDGVRGA
jgi:hypothetical protein